MDVILSSFCFNNYKLSQHKTSNWYTYEPRYTKLKSPFTCLPPISMRSAGGSISPDYSVFFLGESFYIDTETAEIVEKKPMFHKHKELFNCLKELGRLKTIDYGQIIRPYHHLIEKSYKLDVSRMNEWRGEFMELYNIWNSFVTSAREQSSHYDNDGMNPGFYDPTYLPNSMKEILFLLKHSMVPGLDYKIHENLRNWDKGLNPEYKKYTEDILSPYLVHVNSNLCLADCLNASIHDWADLTPLYRKKFEESLRINHSNESKQQHACEQFIKLMFPSFTPKSEKSLMKLLSDKRMDNFRETITKSIDNNISFDNDFANNLLKEIISKEERITYYKNLIGWLTMPLTLIPWAGAPLEKGSKILLEKIVEKRVRKDKAWFYMLSEVNLKKNLLPEPS